VREREIEREIRAWMVRPGQPKFHICKCVIAHARACAQDGQDRSS
jgi:hypothetical protein